MAQSIKVAIVGAGISGLATAYALKNAEQSNNYDITIFEAHPSLGGNAATFEVYLGQRNSKRGGPLTRWVDLGVNDFNRTRYPHVVDIMNRIGMQPGKDYRLLESSECYYTPNGQIIYTDDDGLYHGASDPKRALPKRLKKQFSRLLKRIGKDIRKGKELHPDTTVEQYLAKYEKSLPKEDRAEFILMKNNMLYPRIAAMYFTDPSGPGRMPVLSIYEYYALQEGYGIPGPRKPAERMYFVGGSQRWLEKLAKWMKRKWDVKIKTNYAVDVAPCKDGVRIVKRGGDAEKSRVFDIAVMSCHADDALASLDKRALTPEHRRRIEAVLGKVTYTKATGYAHTYARLLPPDVNAWRSYNVLIRTGQESRPYSMTYVENRHQNDFLAEADPTLRNFAMPLVFITLNPQQEIPDRYILRRAASSSNNQAHRGGYYRDEFKGKDNRAIAHFKHNILNAQCWAAQQALPSIQGLDNLYFCGGWAKQAGLQESCVMMAHTVAATIADSSHTDAFPFGFSSTL